MGYNQKVIPVSAMQAFWRVKVYLHSFIHEHQAEGRSCPAYFTPSATSNHWKGGWIDPRDSMDDLEEWKISRLCQESEDSSVVKPITYSQEGGKFPFKKCNVSLLRECLAVPRSICLT